MFYYIKIGKYYMTSTVEGDRKKVTKGFWENSKKAIISKSNVTDRNNTLKGGTQNVPNVRHYSCSELYCGGQTKTVYIYFKYILVIAFSVIMNQCTLFLPQSKLALNLACEIIFYIYI